MSSCSMSQPKLIRGLRNPVDEADQRNFGFDEVVLNNCDVLSRGLYDVDSPLNRGTGG